MHHLTQEQVKSLLRAVPNDRDRTALLVMYAHGLRVSEAISLRVSDVSGGYITVKRLKGSLKTTQLLIAHKDPLLDERTVLGDLIEAYNLGPSDILFPHPRLYYNRLMLKAGTAAGIPKHLCHPHALKHSIAMHMVKRISIDELKQYLGHRSLNSTGQYLRVDDAQASQAVNAVFQEDND